MKDENATNEVIVYGQALAEILQSFDVVEAKAGWFEKLLIRLLRATYRQRLRVIVETVPANIGDQMLEILRRTGDETL
ncbi:MAG: hypothetical protein BroJett011_41840 [Chloroflexota bacterium]|nr:MAG: hypothetical protein BroJett011_41840 [Chloroflexota bacterium]